MKSTLTNVCHYRVKMALIAMMASTLLHVIAQAQVGRMVALNVHGMNLIGISKVFGSKMLKA